MRNIVRYLNPKPAAMSRFMFVATWFLQLGDMPDLRVLASFPNCLYQIAERDSCNLLKIPTYPLRSLEPPPHFERPHLSPYSLSVQGIQTFKPKP